MHLTLITANPVVDSFTRALADAYAAGARSVGAQLERFDVTELDFDPVLRGAFAEPMPDEPDLARVRAAVNASSHVAWFFPTWWANLPAALKGLVDRLFLPGLTFRYDPGQTLPIGLLAGRSSRYVTTMDSPALWYWLAHHSALEGSFGRGTLKFVGFGPVEKTVITSMRRQSPKARAAWLTRLEGLGARDARRAMGNGRLAASTTTTQPASAR